MKITAAEQFECVSDVLCDVCGDSTRVEGYGLQFGTLQGSWGFGSVHDGERYEVHLCEPFFQNNGRPEERADGEYHVHRRRRRLRQFRTGRSR